MKELTTGQDNIIPKDNVLNCSRNEGIDILKCVCAFLVVTIHCPMIPGAAGEIITAVNRMAVPVFFMITGWFYETTVAREREKTQIIKVLKLVIWSSIFYFVFNGLIASLNGELPIYLRSYLSIKVIVKFFVLTSSPFQGHLWYLSALLYVLIIVKLFCIKFERKWLYYLIPILLLGDLVFGKYSLLLLGRPFPTSLCRNWLFVGLPYFLLGDFLRQKQETIKKILKANNVWLYLLFATFIISTLCEKHFLTLMGMDAERNHFLSSTFISVTAFLISLGADSKIGGDSNCLLGLEGNTVR